MSLTVETSIVVLLPGSNRMLKGHNDYNHGKRHNALFMCLFAWVLARLPYGLNSREELLEGFSFGHSTFDVEFSILADHCVAIATDKVFNTVVALF